MRVSNLCWICLLGACGGEGATTFESLDDEALGNVCADFCAYETGCGAYDVETECVDECLHLGGLIRADAAQSLYACYVGLECDATREGKCLAETIDATEPSAQYDVARAACDDTQSRCGLYYACDLTYWVLLADDVLADLTTCFDADCLSVDACLWEVLNG